MKIYPILDSIDYLRSCEMSQLYSYEVFTDWQDYKVLYGNDELGLDTETTGLDPWNHRLRLIQVYLTNIDEVAILDLWNLTPDQATWLHHLLIVLADSKVVKYLQNALFDLLWFRVKFGIPVRNIIDSMVLSQIDKAGAYEAYKFEAYIDKPNSLESLCEEFGYEHDKQYQKSDWSKLDLSQDQIDYAGRDSILTQKIGKALHERLSVYQPDVVDAELGCLSAFCELNYQSLPVGDINHLFRLWARYREAANGARKSLSNLMPDDPNQRAKIKTYWQNPIYAKRQSDKTAIINPVTGEKASYISIPKPAVFNVGSPLQVKLYMIQKYGAESVEKLDKATGSIKESTGKEVLFEFYSENPKATELKEIIYFRGIDKATSTLESYYNSYDPLRQCMKVNYRSLAPQGMGRSASGDESRKDVQNAQNVSKYLPSHARYELPPIRSAFSAREGYTLLEVDVPASHLLFAGMLSNDSSLRDAKKSGLKVHYYTLSSMLEFEGMNVTPHECLDLVKGKADKGRQDYYEHLYKLSKTVIYSFLNYSGAARLQETFFKFELFVKLVQCKQYLEACAKQYWGLREFQDKAYSLVQSTVDTRYVTNRLTGEQISLGKMGYSMTCDGAKVWHRAQSHQDYKGNWQHKVKISDAVSVQWMRPEGTVLKSVMGKIHDRCVDEWGLDNARLVNFSHDSFIAEIRTELLSDIAPIMCEALTEGMRVYIPDYEPEETWEEQLLKHNWGKYDWHNEPNHVRLAG